MKSGSVWLPLYVGDYLADTGTMTMEQSGAYLQLLMYSWRTARLPVDEGELATLCRMTRTRFVRRVAAVILPLFVEQDGFLISPRLEKERAKTSKKISQKQAAGSAKKRRFKDREVNENNGVSGTDASPPFNQNADSVPVPSPSPSQSYKKEEESPSETCPTDTRSDGVSNVAPAVDPDPVDATLLPTALVLRMPAADDLDAAVDAWNALASELALPKVVRMTDTRRRALRVRLKEAGGLKGWMHALDEVRQSAFLRGDKPGRNGDPFTASFDFMLQASTFQRVMEGSYRDRRPASTGNPFEDFERNRMTQGTI